MKHKLLPLLLILLCACSSNTTTLTVNDPLSYSVRIKDNAEFILVKEGTSIEDFNDILLDNLDIDTNADTYDVDWYGEAYSYLTREDVLSVAEQYEDYSLYNDKHTTVNDAFKDDITDTSVAKELTLNNESFRPIELIIDFTKDGQTETLYKQILLCVAQDTEYNAIANNNATTVEDAYIALWNDAPRYTYSALYQIAKEEGHYSNIRAAKYD